MNDSCNEDGRIIHLSPQGTEETKCAYFKRSVCFHFYWARACFKVSEPCRQTIGTTAISVSTRPKATFTKRLESTVSTAIRRRTVGGSLTKLVTVAARLITVLTTTATMIVISIVTAIMTTIVTTIMTGVTRNCVQVRI